MKIILIKELLALVLYVCMVFGLTITPATAQQPSGRIGFSLKVQADGFFNPKVTKIVVDLVEPQAQKAGLSLGDELIKVQDVIVPGTDASVLKPHMEFVSGKPKKLLFRRPNGQTYEAMLVKP
jgi:ABC-type sugar transport system substrate-binding protein